MTMATTKVDDRTKSGEPPPAPREDSYQVEMVKSELITHNPWQPRQVINPDELLDLAENIATQGLLQPPLGRRQEKDAVQLAFGHRRLEAIRLLIERNRWDGDTIPVTIRELTDSEMVLFALTENSKRKDLTPLEEYRSYARAIEEVDGLTIQSMADAIGVDRSTLSNNLRILQLPQVVLERVESGEMAARAAREFLALMNDDHCHEREMDWVIKTIASTSGMSGAPDWRTAHVRRELRAQCARFEKEWRPLEGRDNDPVDSIGYGHSGSEREPTFDTEAFVKENPAQAHILPAGPGGQKSRSWTCNVKEWRRRQTTATRELNKQAEEKGESKVNATTSQQAQASRIVQDLVLKQIRKAGVVMETDGKVMPANTDGGTVQRTLDRGKKAQISEDEKAALGTRAEPPRDVHGVKFSKPLDSNRHDIPSYFPDLEECQTRCTWGAGYGYQWRGDPSRLY